MKSSILIIAAILLIIFFSGCQKKQPTNPINDGNKDGGKNVDMQSLVVDENFNYRTTNEVDVRLSVFTNVNKPVPGIPFDIYADLPGSPQKHLACCVTDKYGFLEIKLNVPFSVKELTVVGFMQERKIPIMFNQVTAKYGGISGHHYSLSKNVQPIEMSNSDIYPVSDVQNTMSHNSLFKESKTNVSFSYVTDYTTGGEGGVPLTMEFDEISADFVQRITLALPERKAVPDNYPKYLAEDNEIDCIITETCDVWVTFMNEGAGYLNSLGYVTYSTASGYPSNPENLDHIIVFPNASGNGTYPDLFSGGGLNSGDKVYLGRFEAGTSIGWFLCQNAWDGSEVNNTAQRFYSNPDYNPETDPTKRQHNVLLFDETSGRLILAFDDQEREGTADNDFNDAVFYVTVNPPEAVDLSEVVETIPQQNPFNIITSNEGTVAFEDKWPEQGDYDFNDLVINYTFTEHLNGENEINQIDANITLRAIGAAYDNGFGIEFPFPSSGVTLEDNGNSSIILENDSRTIVQVFDNAYDFFPESGNNFQFVNTQGSHTYYDPVELSFSLYLSTPIVQGDFEYTDPTAYNSNIPVTPPYNPFLFVNGVRGHEVHMPDYPPTSQMNTNLLGQNDDSTSPYLKRYYKTSNGYPWAMHIPIEWNYPKEKYQITYGFLDFPMWAESNGGLADNWYDKTEASVDLDFIFIY